MTALLQVRNLTKKYFGLAAVDDVSYDVEAGAIVGLIGPNGSGKSTSIDCISGFQPADSGRWNHASSGCGASRRPRASHPDRSGSSARENQLARLERRCGESRRRARAPHPHSIHAGRFGSRSS
jgi:ABC-type branched-subunit amino acid transport system ATPase component